jgi:hypothetical protein
MGISTPFKAEKGLDIVTGNLTQPKGSDVASTAALPWSTTGNFRDVTGTTAITSLATSGKVGSSQTLQFDNVLTLTHNATTLILPGGADITTAAGDIFTFTEYSAGNWVCSGYVRASGSSIVDAGGAISHKTSAYTAVSGDVLTTNTSGGAFTITLPATPSTSDSVTIYDTSGWSTDNLTVARNGSTIEGLAEDVTMNLDYIVATFIYSGSTWRIYANVVNLTGNDTVTLTGDVTGSGVGSFATTIDPTAVSGKATVSAVAGDFVLLHDATDSTLKKANASDFLFNDITISTKTTTYTAVAGDYLAADTSGGAFTITLPATPSTNDRVTIYDVDDWETNNLTVARNGSTIASLAEDVTMDVKSVIVTFLYDGTTWLVYGTGQAGLPPSSGLTEVVDDTSPQLGANLDANSFSITGLHDINFSQDNPEILGGDTNGVLNISGNSAALGGRVSLYGNTHASKPGHIEFLDDAAIVGEYDASTGSGVWDFQAKNITTTGTISGSSITATSTISATGTVSGSNLSASLLIGTDVQAYDADIPTVAASQVEMETGTETALRSMSPLRVKQAIDANSFSTGKAIAMAIVFG